MRLTKTKSVVMALILTACLFTNVLAATSFPDVTEDSYGWALEAVEEMSAEGIIKGYEDGSFRPANTVTKLEALVLIARILGVNNDANAELMVVATEEYGDKVNEYDLPYGENEIIFLLAKDVISETELSGYVSGSNASSGLKRFEVAILMTKAMGAEEEVKANLVTVLDYEDEADIPSNAKKYVEYVTNEGIMMGMDENHFSPNTDVVRAQAAVLLKRIIDKAQIEEYAATVSSIDKATEIVKFITNDGESYAYSLKEGIKTKCDGEICTIDDVKVGYHAVVTTRAGKLYSIDFITPDSEGVVKGIVTSVAKNTGKQTIKLDTFKEDGTTESVTYTCAENYVVSTKDGGKSINDVAVGNYAELTLKKDEVISIYAEPKTSNAKGTVKNIEINSGAVTVVITNLDGEEESYMISSAEVAVTRNGKASEISAVVAGDSVSLTLTHRQVTKVVATSKTSTKTGVIDEIKISANPSITLTINGENVVYPLSKDVTITIEGKSGTIYDLRLAASATVTLDSDTITKISTTPVEAVSQITGTVEFVNVSYGLIQVKYFDSASAQEITRSVFVNKNATILNSSTGKELTLKTLPTNSTVTIVGTSVSGVFEANTIIVISTK